LALSAYERLRQTVVEAHPGKVHFATSSIHPDIASAVDRD
jgi:hypothetical protein